MQGLIEKKKLRDNEGHALRDIIDGGVPGASPLFNHRLLGLGPFFKVFRSMQACLNDSRELDHRDLHTRFS